jgi:hypothetical protein
MKQLWKRYYDWAEGLSVWKKVSLLTTLAVLLAALILMVYENYP